MSHKGRAVSGSHKLHSNGSSQPTHKRILANLKYSNISPRIATLLHYNSNSNSGSQARTRHSSINTASSLHTLRRLNHRNNLLLIC
jgi:hypothetical protein